MGSPVKFKPLRVPLSPCFECSTSACLATRETSLYFYRVGQTIVIVGAGFCGSVLAAQLLRRPPPRPTEIVLIERGTAIARGVAYAALDIPYVLNVPAGRLSVDPADALHFLRYARQSIPAADAE